MSFIRRIGISGRALTAAAIVAGALGMTSVVFSFRRSEEHQHTMKCLAAYMAFIQVIGAPEEEGIERLTTCEQAAIGEEPIHLVPREHPFVVTQYEACLAAHLLMSSDLKNRSRNRNNIAIEGRGGHLNARWAKFETYSCLSDCSYMVNEHG